MFQRNHGKTRRQSTDCFLSKSKETKENPKKRKIASDTASEAILLNPKNQRNFFIQRIEKSSPSKGAWDGLYPTSTAFFGFLWICCYVVCTSETKENFELNFKKINIFFILYFFGFNKATPTPLPGVCRHNIL